MKRFLLGLGFILLAAAGTAGANDLQILQDTKAYEELSRQTDVESRRQKDVKWAPPGKNYSFLFRDNTGGNYIHAWLGVPDTGLRQIHQQSVTHKEFVSARRYYQTKGKEDLELMVLVPHPRHLMKVELDLVKDFYTLKPPWLKYDSMEKITIQGQSGFIYELAYGGLCHVLLNLAKGTVINIRGKCTIREDMLNLANSLSIDRLNRKLES